MCTNVWSEVFGLSHVEKRKAWVGNIEETYERDVPVISDEKETDARVKRQLLAPRNWNPPYTNAKSTRIYVRSV